MNTSQVTETVRASPAHGGVSSLTLANAQLVLSDRVITGAVVIDAGLITAVTEGTQVPAGAVNCRGDYVLPGMVELHTDNLERHIEPRPDVDWPHLPAILAHDAELASTGITTVFDALRVGTRMGSKARSRAYARQVADEILAARADGLCRISHFLHLRAEICSDTLLEELAEFGPKDRVGIVSLMDHTPGQRQFRDLTALRAYLTKKRGLSDDDFSAHVAHLRAMQARYGAVHEAGAVREADRFNAVLASHDDTTKEQVATSRRNGCRFAEFPTTLEAAQACRDQGIAVMMGAPNLVRGTSHSGNVAAADLAREGLLDIVSSDYVPASLLHAVFELAAMGQPLHRAVACVTQNAARAAGLLDRGRLASGLRGDVVRVSMHGNLPLIRGVWSQGVRVG
ncbi:MAG: alpha-D-ribose 1-methylphosphonate 5-triphosphate diphosphatase [Pseudomonadota bacterium]